MINNLNLKNYNGQTVIGSKKVAEILNIEHENILKEIDNAILKIKFEKFIKNNFVE